MKILFFVDTTARLRYFEEVVPKLAKRGHTVRIVGRTRGNEVSLPRKFTHPLISLIDGPRTRVDEWRKVAPSFRAARDYARYLDPRFAHAAPLRERLGNRFGLEFLEYCERRPWLKRQWRLLGWMLKIIEAVIPSDRAFEDFLKAERPDVVLITPLVTFRSYATDYIKSAHKLGIPVAFVLFSWDNLSSKGLIRVCPDRAIVWNDTTKWEAVALHGVPADRVIVTGAPRFDKFFRYRPSTSREEFCTGLGLDPERPFILYLGSSDLIASREVEFARTWVREIRHTADSALGRCGILVRPHPTNRASWEVPDLLDLPNVVLQRWEDGVNVDQLLYDSLHHAATVVGLNTSALIEAGIVGRSVHTVIAPEALVPGQAGTLHFDYLARANGGLLRVARNFEEHRRQLAAALAAPPSPSEQSLRFIEGFVRPRGLERPVAPIMVREIERLGRIRKAPQGRTPVWHYPLRWAVLAWLSAKVFRGKPERWDSVGIAGYLAWPGVEIDSVANEHRMRQLGRRHGKPAKGLKASVVRLVDAAMIELVGRRLRRTRDSGTLVRSWRLLDSLPNEVLGDFYANYNVVSRMDYARHAIHLRRSSNFIEKRLLACKKEPFTVAWIEEFIKPGDVFYDIGANVGSYALIAAKFTGGQARVFAFEPSFSTFAELCRNISLNECDGSVKPLAVALWSESSVAGLTYHALDPAAAKHQLSAKLGTAGSSDEKPVLTLRLDDLVKNFHVPAPNHIKLDVDGAELGVLQGAAETLGNGCVRSLIVEIDDRQTADKDEIYRLLESAGFRPRSEHRRKDTAPLYAVFSKQ